MAETLDKRNLTAATVAVVLGIAITAQGANYPIGDLTQMGPGFFPTAIGILVVLLGLVLGIVAIWRPETETIEVDWRPLLLISAALVVFAFTLTPLGLAPATVLLVAIASFAQPGFRPLMIAGVSLFLVVMTGVIFVYGLNMPLSLVAGWSP